MGRVKVVLKSANDEENVEDVNGRSKSPSKPASNVKKTFKAHVKPPLKNMVLNALKELDKDNGVLLVSIRNYIRKIYNNGRPVGKDKQQRIKQVIEDEFNKGKIEMTDSDADKINFTKRFKMAAE